MRLARLRSLLFVMIALLVVGAGAGCENPLDPLNKSDKIEGLKYIEFSATWDRWDSDPQYDGMSFQISYFNEFGDALTFHDKPHNVVIEFWSRKDIGGATTFWAKDRLLFTRTFIYSSSDDIIRVPVELYAKALAPIIDPETGAPVPAFVVVRVFPPKAYPQTELFLADPEVTLLVPETAEGALNP